jgi:hypothetical protein
MDSDSFYCVATQRSDSKTLEASVTFPRPLDTSHEIALVYCSFVTDTPATNEIWLKAKSIQAASSGSAPGTWTVNFDNVPAYIPPAYIVPAISRKLIESVGNAMDKGTPVKIYHAGKFMGWWLKIQKYTEIELSPSLAGILGQNTLITNNSNKPIELPVNPDDYSYSSHGADEVFYLTCNQLLPNCITEFGGATRLLDVVHLNGGDRMVKYSPTERIYQPLADDILHPKINVQLINRHGISVLADITSVNTPGFYVLLHLRKTSNNGPNRKGKLA